jgi:threonine dehydrogenase-like Zn-dependent dehydrogenase
MGTKHTYAIDSNPSRLKTVEKHGTKPLNLSSEPQSVILSATHNRGADVVIETIGHGDALRLAYPLGVFDNSFDILRPFRFVVSIGVQQDPLPWSMLEQESQDTVWEVSCVWGIP